MISRFLLASLNMDAVLAEATLHQRRQALHRITKGIGLQDAYDTTVNRIRQQGGSKSRLGMEALMWISHCGRPLGSQELCHALGVELGAEDFSIHNAPSIRTVLGYTLGLAIIDEKASTPRLLHFTLQAYLEQHPTLFVTAHSMMAEICLTYLISPSIQALRPNLDLVGGSIFDPPQCPGLDDALRETPFLEYATCFWGPHATMGVTEPVKSLALRLLNGYENHVSAAVLSRKKIRYWDRNVQGITGLHCIAFLGIVEIASTMLERKGRQVNRRDSRSRTPLMWAVEYKNRRMVELFLEQEDIEADTVIRDGRTVFSFAAELGNEDAVKLLLGRRDVNLNSGDSDGRTPLSFAAGRGKEGVVKLLLERGDVDPNSSDNDGQTPLLFATKWGDEGVVDLLLERGDLDPNSSDSNGRTPLLFAAMRGYEGVVKLLLERGDLDPNSSDNNGRTPLLFAIEREHEGVVKLLLKRGDLDPNSFDNNGRTPLLFAAERGDEGVVGLLLERGDVDPNSSDNNGRTPLSFAVQGLWKIDHFGNRFFPAPLALGVAKLLLEREDLDPNVPDSNGRTLLSFATEQRQEGLVRLLLERGDVDPNSSDNNGRTPLSFAVEGLRKIDDFDFGSRFFLAPLTHGFVKLLLEREDVDPNLPDSNGRTVLSFAAEWGREVLVRLLLERGNVDPNSSDNNGRTPLSFAAQRGQEGVVKLLLERGDIDPNSSDNNGQTPLSLATERGQEGVLKLLLDHGDVNPNPPDSNGQNPLSYATIKEREGVVSLLSDSRTPNCESPQNRLPTPTHVTRGTLGNGVTHSPTAMEPIALHTENYSLKRKGAGEQSTLEKRRK